LNKKLIRYDCDRVFFVYCFRLSD